MTVPSFPTALDTWVEAFLDGTLTAEQERDLRVWLEAADANLDAFIEQVDLHGALWEEMGQGAAAGDPAGPAHRLGRPWRLVAAAAATLALVFVTWWLVPPADSAPRSVPPRSAAGNARFIALQTRAQALQAEAGREADPQVRRERFQAAEEAFLAAVAVAREEEDRDARARDLAPALFHSSVCALEARDYATGYVVSFALVREFGSENYPRARFPAARSLARQARAHLERCARGYLEADRTSAMRQELLSEQQQLRRARGNGAGL